MKNRKSKILVIALISTLTLAMGCTITTTRNKYYVYPDKSIESSQNDVGSNYTSDTLTMSKDGQD